MTSITPTGSMLQYGCLVLALSQEVVTPHHCFLQTITAATPDPYELLKTCLLQTYAPMDTDLLSQLLAAVELGDQQPTDMMYTMRSQLPQNEPAGKLFLALYLQRLPAPLRERVAAKHVTDPQQMAEYADTLWESQLWLPITTAVLSAARLRLVASPHCSRSQGCSAFRPRSDGLLARHWCSLGLPPQSQATSAPTAYIHYYNERFGVAASNCQPPCAWLENSGATGGN